MLSKMQLKLKHLKREVKSPMKSILVSIRNIYLAWWRPDRRDVHLGHPRLQRNGHLVLLRLGDHLLELPLQFLLGLFQQRDLFVGLVPEIDHVFDDRARF